MFNKEKLDAMVLDIEFLLISVVQGVALTALAVEAAPHILDSLKIEYLPYLFTGFMFVLIFWSQAIIHAISFIDWPLNILHTFLYFLASFVEVLTFHQIENPKMWFLFSFIFFIVAGLLYIIDGFMIKQREKKFSLNATGKKLYLHIYTRQKFELFVLLPLGLVFNLSAYFLISSSETFYIFQKGHIIFGFIQSIFCLGLLINSIVSFKRRSQLITDCTS